MKKITTITLGLLLSLSTFANVRTVNNFVPNVAQFSNVQSAINASAVGDTLLIHGTPVTYGDITLNRRLCLIGAGSNLTNTVNNYKTTLGIITVDSTNSNPNLIVSGFSIHGIEFSNFSFGSIQYANNVVVSRCSFNASTVGSSITGHNWVIKNCFIPTLLILANFGRVSSNIIIANNIINGSILNGSSTIFAPNVIATNNIILNSSGGVTFNVLLTNNIFFNTIPNSIGGNVFNKNLTYTASSTLLVNLPPTGNTGTGNINNTIPNFINVPNPTSLFKTPAMANYNFAFPTAAAAYNAGTDGTNLGITGGPYPWNGNNLDGRAQIPLMQELNIINSVINQGQPLNVDFKARKNN
jgi:hypothetical protein